MKIRNHTQRLLAIFLALALLFCAGAGLSAFAATPTGSITVKNDPAKTHVSIAGENYNAYRIFDLSQNADHTAYAYTLNSAFAELFESAAFTAAFPSSGLTNDSATSEIYRFVSTLTAAGTETFAKAVHAFTIAETVTATATATAAAVTGGSAETAVFANLPLGYYLVFGTGKSVENSEEVVGACILDTTTWDETQGRYALEINVKLGVPSVEKTIIKGQSSLKADAVSIGDVLTFRVASSVPVLTGYTSYTFQMTDTMSRGLTFAADTMTVKIGEDTIAAAKYDLAQTTSADGVTTITVTFKDFYGLVTAAHYAANTPITFTYQATLNERAVIGAAGNPNKAQITYSNDPHTDSTGDSIEDEVKVYSFELDIHKFAMSANERIPLSGAQFNLKKQGARDLISFVLVDGIYRVTAPNTTGSTTTIISDASGNIVVKGLGAGTYELIETVAPDGYNKLEAPIILKIEPEYDATNPKELSRLLESETDAAYGLLADYQGIETDVENATGSELPATGGMGTTILYVIGGLLIVTAVTALVVKRLAGRRGQN